MQGSNLMTKRIAMWSGPRNISTAMMRSWENRADTHVVDEPFYAYYLQQTQSPHPYFDEILQAQSSDYAQVTKALCHGVCGTPLQYQKQMTHHMLDDVDMSWTTSLIHCFLIRDPAQVVNSYTNSRGVCCAEDIGIIRQAQLYKEISLLTGQDIPVIDSNDVLANPKGILSALCDRLGIPFDEAMLSWPAGKRDSDGVWAPHWYHSVEQSTGFAQTISRVFELSSAQQLVVNEVRPHFEYLFEKRIRVV
jgi:hypothetical protein